MKMILRKSRPRWLGGLTAGLTALIVSGFAVSSLGEGIRLGTNVTVYFSSVEAGREILKQSGLNFIVAETMKDAAEKVVAAAK